jgi:hypothetical protein
MTEEPAIETRQVDDEAVSGNHRRMLGQLRVIVQTLIEGANDISSGDKSVKPGVFSDRETVSDIVVKLAGVLTKLIALEREAHGLDETIDPKELSDGQITRLLDRRRARGGASGPDAARSTASNLD